MLELKKGGYMNYFLLILMGYAIGNIPCSYIVGKLMGNIDVRQHGSGNAGATNVLRTVGKKAALLALIGDILKGVIPAIIGYLILGTSGAYIAAVFAVIGHCYPIVLGFKGGKGVATSGGMIFGTNPLIAIALLLYMLIVVKSTKYVSLASITGAFFYPFIIFFLYGTGVELGASVFLAILVIYKHRANIQRLVNKEENKTTLFG